MGIRDRLKQRKQEAVAKAEEAAKPAPPKQDKPSKQTAVMRRPVERRRRVRVTATATTTIEQFCRNVQALRCETNDDGIVVLESPVLVGHDTGLDEDTLGFGGPGQQPIFRQIVLDPVIGSIQFFDWTDEEEPSLEVLDALQVA